MIKSMTGYGRFESVLSDKKILAEIRSVNHRFSDYTIKIPKNMMFLEDKIRCLVSEYIARGKVDIFISIDNFDGSDKEIVLNKKTAEGYIKALYDLRDTFNLKDDISVSNIALFGDIFTVQKREEDEEQVWKEVRESLVPALEAFVKMREREGERIYKDLNDRVVYMKSLLEKIKQREPEIVVDYKARLYEKIKEVLDDRSIDEARVLTEVAIFADKIAINEELVRLDSHFDECTVILNGSEAAGRRLDFLIQEMNREVNTIGSKANDILISKLVVELKGELEKFREQVQNVE